MKTCAYCGRESEDAAARCRECGTDFVAAPPVAEHSSAPSVDEERLQRIAVLDNQVQAGLVDGILADRDIPHIMQTYHDSAYDGIFQTQGWGVVLAPASFREEILTILQDIKQQSQS